LLLLFPYYISKKTSIAYNTYIKKVLSIIAISCLSIGIMALIDYLLNLSQFNSLIQLSINAIILIILVVSLVIFINGTDKTKKMFNQFKKKSTFNS